MRSGRHGSIPGWARTATDQAESVYAVFGDVAADGTAYPLQMPAAYQNPAPFGAHIGGVNKHIVKFRSEAKYDAHPTVHR